VVASRNRREELLHSLPRHLALPERPHVVVVDDASTDGSGDAVRSAHPEVEVVRLERNLGGAARNHGVEAAGTEYAAFCDDDSWFAPGALARAVALLDRNPRLALVNAHILVGPEERVDPVCEEMAASPLPRAEEQPGHPLLSFIACAVVVRSSAFLGAGGFTPRFRVGGEEELLGWDLAAGGWLMSYVPEIVAHHHPPRSAGRPERREIGVRNTLWTTWLRRPVGAAARRTLHDLRRFPPDRITARAIARALAGVPWVLGKRRVSPPHVERMRRMLEPQQLGSKARRYV
jgi:N-acetylglucosaminyl-diphospho-decaprenol L-rhamnosyltransferase